MEPLRRRAESALRQDLSSSARRAVEALPERGVVLDVGVGFGAGSLPLARHAGHIIGIDRSRDVLDEFAKLATAAGVQVD
ncbi:MAG TPA: class I SAM-dependent methyltransferase, partial [Acidimicrobiales bacterium]|nr:class I SAM-dependent methyltransferase [Acidimicrobiales bacterium]